MIHVLAGCLGAVVATKAVVTDSGMVEHGGHECRCRMAIVALVAGQDVIGAFATRLSTVVARHAVADNGNVVDEGDRRPGRGRVAVRALVGGRNVIEGFSRRDDWARRRVAADAIGIRAFEAAAGVASITACSRVRAIQFEAGTEVIECVLRAADRAE